MREIFGGAAVFDGERFLDDAVVIVEDGHIVSVAPPDPGLAGTRVALTGGVLAPGLIDLQVNGGGGRMVGAATDLAAIHAICAAHARLGTTGLLPTLITDTPDATARVVATAIAASEARVPGFLGLHLEGPHLDPRRKGAHEAGLIRPMTTADLDLLCHAAARLPSLMVTVAPEAVTSGQIARLTSAGVVVSLGHSDCTLAQAREAISAGASCATHLFNAMSQLGSREPGLVGAVLGGGIAAGLIADAIHVAPATLRIAIACRPEGLFLVSDAMSVAGTELAEFRLGERRILRRDGRLTLEDGTLAGADLSLPQAVRVLIRQVGVSPRQALAMATSVPARVIGADRHAGYLTPGRAADMVHLDDDWQLTQVWKAGQPLLPGLRRD